MALMRLLPKSALSATVGRLTRVKAPATWHRAAMRAFARRYQVDLSEAEAGIDGFRTFSEFFSRRLKTGLRSVDADPRSVVSPVDGVVSQIGVAAGFECLQAKGISYPLSQLLAGDTEAQQFRDGPFITLYLSPRDYHRIHAPVAGEIEGFAYLPGEFWPVNPISVRRKSALFCLNERLITYMKTPAGHCAVVKVGATCVSRIRASYDNVITHSGRKPKSHRYPAAIGIRKGEELGAFEMGSTVILLFEKGRVQWLPTVAEGSRVRMGMKIGEIQ